MVRTQHFHCQGLGLSGQETKILRAVQCDKKKGNKKTCLITDDIIFKKGSGIP